MLTIGTVIGLAAAIALARVMSSLLFGVGPTDFLTFAAVSVGALIVALLACYINCSAHRMKGKKIFTQRRNVKILVCRRS